MILDFDKMPETEIKNFYGGKKCILTRMHTDNYNRIMKVRLVPGASVGVHKHETSSEIIFVIKGEGKGLFDGKEEIMKAGTCHYCPKGHSHGIINNSKEDLVLYASVVTQ